MNAQRKTVTVEVAEIVSGDEDFRIPLDELSAIIAEAVEEIPVEYRATAALRIRARSSSDDYATASAGIEYQRTETDAELAARSERESHNTKQREAYERSQYEALKRKFEPATSPSPAPGEGK